MFELEAVAARTKEEKKMAKVRRRKLGQRWSCIKPKLGMRRRN